MKYPHVLIHPVISEKAAFSEEKGVYTFRVAGTANKAEVKKAVEGLFSAKVTQVRIVNTAEKTKRRGRITGTISSWKKAYVTVEKGAKIQLKPEAPKTKVKTKEKTDKPEKSDKKKEEKE